MGPYLSVPNTEKDIENGEGTKVRYGACGMQGWRNTMEDSHIASCNLENNVTVFGVFDGHGGCEVALYVKDRFITELKKLKSFQSKDYQHALKDLFIKIDDMLNSHQGKKDILQYRSQEQAAGSLFGRPETDDISFHTGCTACVVLITESEIYCANAGDSRCVLSCNGKSIDMSVDHKPDNPGEKARIQKAGGFVEDNRVKGVLNLSRSLGDLEYKKEKLPVEAQMITCVPEIKVEKLKKEHDFMIIACDGIWDCLTSQECITMVRDYINTSANKGKPLSSCIEYMFDNIIATDMTSSGGIGCDNMTAVIVQFK